MRNYEQELKDRVAYIKRVVRQAGAKGIVFGNSGGKDSALVGILCKKAEEHTVGIMMPCDSTANYGQDITDANLLKNTFEIASEILDLTDIKKAMITELEHCTTLNKTALINIPPRLRMVSLYTYAAAHNMLVAGTGNKCERYVGYFTKWGDGAFDFNPIADLTVSEIYEFLMYLKAPQSIVDKAPSAGLYEGQTDEIELGVTYKEIEDYMNHLEVKEESRLIIEKMHHATHHKRAPMNLFEK